MLIRIIVLSLYALMIIWVGIRGFRGTKTFNDFYLGGGNVGPWMTAFSYGVAYFSAVLFIGFAGNIGWNFGYSGLWIALVNSLLGVLVVWRVVGMRLKDSAIEYNAYTMPEFLKNRYRSPELKLLASLVIFIFMIPYTAAVFMGLSYLFTSNFDIEYWHALAFMGFFTALYMVLGGYKSMALIDMIFGMIMAVSVIILFFSTVSQGGGLQQITFDLRAIDPQLTQAVGPPGWWPLLSLVLLTSMAPFAMPQLMQKFYAIKDKATVKKGMLASTLFAILIGGVAYFIGSTSRIFLSPEATPAAFDIAGRPIYDILMPELLTNVVPVSLSVIILLLILSASMSTLAALVLVSSSTFVKDFYQGFINNEVKDKTMTLLMRIMSALFILLSVILAYLNLDSIVAILGISWGALGSFFLGPFIWGLYSKKVRRSGAIASGTGGLCVCLLLYASGMPSPQAGTIGMFTSLALNPLVSYLRNRHTKVPLILLLLLLPASLFAAPADDNEAQEESSRFSMQISGFVKTDYWVDSRTVVAAREDLFLMYPANKLPDANGKDVYGDPVFNFSAITSRVLVKLEGPDAFGAQVDGMIEADFSGVTNADINGFRLRHAYLNLRWEDWNLMLGQYWHPLFAPQVIPTVVSLNTGAPFQPFIRNPQVSLTHFRGQSQWMFALIGQRDNASDGPRGTSPDYLRQTTLPNAHVQWLANFGGFTAGMAADYKVLRPRLTTDANFYTSESIGSYAFMAYGRYRLDLWDIKIKTIYGQNLSEHLMLGGYAESHHDPETGHVQYTPLNHLSAWTNVLYGDRVLAGLFLGYAHNFGASDVVTGQYYGRGSDIAYLYRISPSLTFTSGRLALCTELEYTAAAYGTPDGKGKVNDSHEVGNMRLLFTALYYF
ncbi:MAG: sodium:solute symporter family protein [Bacteroidia bacterium]|nr:MAG: sodium:solute symporter family protein [Bacteroidia bacterium]